MATEYDRFAPGNIKIVGEREPGRIASEIGCYVQHFKRAHCCDFHPAGFLHDLPEPRYMTETVELTAEQAKLIRRMEDTYVAWLEQEARDANRALVAKLPIDARIRLRQMTLAVPSFDENGTLTFAPGAASPKLDKLIELYERVGEPIVASTSSKLFAHEAVRRLNERGIRSFEWSSSAKQADRDQALADFEAGDYDVIVGVTEAIGTGIDGLQAASGVLVSLERSEDLASEIQLESRLDRRGQRRADGVLHYEIIAEGAWMRAS
jgi:SNF2 family DNA or RNA helicase